MAVVESSTSENWLAQFVLYRKLRPRTARLLDGALVFLLFGLYAGMPIPDANEAHYLAKAKHYWNPAWCAGDVFLESIDAHQVFFWLFGWTTLFLPLKTVMCVGRVVVLLLQSWSWQRLHWAIFRKHGAFLSASMLVLVSHNTQMAGEWIFGGVEAKGFAFVFLFLAVESLVRGRWNRLGICLGAATAFHVLVGGWATIVCGGFVLALGKSRPTLRSIAPGLWGGLLLALPSIAFGLRLSWGVDAALLSEAHRIQFVDRIHHHLNPFVFKSHVAAVQIGVFLASLTASMRGLVSRNAKWVVAFAAGAGGIALVGFLIAVATGSHSDWAAAILRFYWFRLFDVAVPMAAAVVAFGLLTEFNKLPKVLAMLTLLFPLGYSAFLAQRALNAPIPKGDKYVADERDWREACDWVANHTRPTDRFLTPGDVGTFKLYANRAEVATWKDMPQDPTSIVAWWRRMLDFQEADKNNPKGDPAINRWRMSLGTLGTDRLQTLSEKYAANYVVVVKEWQIYDHSKPAVKIPLPKLALDLAFENAHYAIYRFSSESPPDQSKLRGVP